MLKHALILSLILFVSSNRLSAQNPNYGLPTGTVGVPYTFDFDPGLEAELQAVQSELAAEGVTLTLTFSTTGTLPPGISFSNATFSGTPTTAGTYPVTIGLTVIIIYQGQTVYDAPVESIPVTIQINGYSGAMVSVDPSALTFALTGGSTSQVSQSISISNHGAQAQSFTASVGTSSGGQWLSVSPASGMAPFGSTTLSVNVDPTKITTGTYTGTINVAVSPAGQMATISVVATVSSGQAQIELSQSGLLYQSVDGGGTPSAQTIVVQNGGAGSFTFNASASTSSGQNWLSVTPSSGSVSANSAAVLTVNVNPSALDSGNYYGQVKVSASGVQNSPQIAPVILSVAKQGTDIGAFVRPTGLIFVGQAGGTNPTAQTVSVTNPAASSLMYTATASFQSGSSQLSVQPASGTVNSSTPLQIQIQPNISGLAAGIYTGEVDLYFSDTNSTVDRIGILLVVIPSATGHLEAQSTPHATCSPTQLLPVFTQLGAGFGTVASWPTPIEVTVVDDCGNFQTSGSVIASFSSGDPALTLVSLQNGKWSATWNPRNSVTAVTITAQAQETSPAIKGTASIGGSLQANPTAPVISPGGAVSAVSFAGHQPLAPGSLLSVFGSNLSVGSNAAATLPLNTQLGSTQVVLGGEQLPLLFAAGQQVNAIVPYDVSPNTTQQVIVMNGPAISVPEPIIISPAQPAVITLNSSGTGAAIVVGQKPDGTQFLVGASNPLTAGDYAIIYCSGLGPVSPPVPAGSAAPIGTLSNTTNPVTVTIGGQSQTAAFAGLAPGFAGLYQVNVPVPSGITPGNAVPLVLTVEGQSSTPVTVVVQ